MQNTTSTIADPQENYGNFLLGQIRLDHGPVAMLGRFLIEAEARARASGITLSIGTLDDLLAVNAANSDSWLPLVGVFDPRNGGVSSANSFAILGRNAQGEIVATNAARLYSWPDSSFFDEITSLRLFYSDVERMRRAGESCEVTAQSTRMVTGQVVYSGAAWCRPDVRGRRLSTILPRMTKAIAFGYWNPEFVVSLMTKSVHSHGFLKMLGYTHIDWKVEWRNASFGDSTLAFLWMTGHDVIQHVGDFSSSFPTEVKGQIFNRSA